MLPITVQMLAALLVAKVKLVRPLVELAVSTTVAAPSVTDSVGAKVTVWLDKTKVNAPTLVAVPPAVVTTTFTAPVACAGVVAVIWVAELTVKLLAATPPKLTAVAPVRLVPTMVTDVPPRVGPLVSDTELTVGGDT